MHDGEAARRQIRVRQTDADGGGGGGMHAVSLPLVCIPRSVRVVLKAVAVFQFSRIRGRRYGTGAGGREGDKSAIVKSMWVQ